MDGLSHSKRRKNGKNKVQILFLKKKKWQKRKDIGLHGDEDLYEKGQKNILMCSIIIYHRHDKAMLISSFSDRYYSVDVLVSLISLFSLLKIFFLF